MTIDTLFYIHTISSKLAEHASVRNRSIALLSASTLNSRIFLGWNFDKILPKSKIMGFIIIYFNQSNQKIWINPSALPAFQLLPFLFRTKLMASRSQRTENAEKYLVARFGCFNKVPIWNSSVLYSIQPRSNGFAALPITHIVYILDVYILDHFNILKSPRWYMPVAKCWHFWD